MIIYIAGPMSGYPNFNHEAFYRAETDLRASGHIVINPAKLPKGLPDQAFLPICMAMIEAADAVFFLRNWQHSEGAKAEYYYAKRQRKDLFFEEPKADQDPDRVNTSIADSYDELEL